MPVLRFLFQFAIIIAVAVLALQYLQDYIMLHFTDYITFKVVHSRDIWRNVTSYYTVAVNGIDSNFEEIDEAAEFISSQNIRGYGRWNVEDIKTILLANIQQDLYYASIYKEHYV